MNKSAAIKISSKDKRLACNDSNRQVIELDQAIADAQQALVNLQHPDGYWLFELEADCTIPAEYIMMMHYLDKVDEILQAKIANFLRTRQNKDGSYPLFPGGVGDLSCTTKVYYALKLAGEHTHHPHMKKMRDYILSQGGAARCNVFTRIALAIFEQLPWRGVPYIPVEIMFLPKWFPFHLDKVSYWSRTVMVPLFILCTLKAKAKNPKKVDILELFTVHPDQENNYFPDRSALNKFFLALDKLGKMADPLIPGWVRQKAIRKALDWFIPRLNGEDGLGGIFPAMVNAYEAMLLAGIPEDDERVVTAKKAIDKLLVVNKHDAYCQPCLSPIWDTALSILPLQEADSDKNSEVIDAAIDWLVSKQLKDEPGDWQVNRPNLQGGGWAFQFDNAYYPDVDDTAVVGFALAQADKATLKEPIERATRWIAGMQSKNGGFGAFDADNTCYYLNHIPFADHGALLDPPTVDVSARCAMLLSKLVDKSPQYVTTLDQCIQYLRNEQEHDGSWFGRWGTNYIYGTWSTLVALEQVGIPNNDPMTLKGIRWLKSKQREDGGWGEDNESYHDDSYRGEYHTSTAVHTSWALLGLLAVGEVNSPEVEAGINYLLDTQYEDGFWHDEGFNAPGFPKVFYLKYHGYDKFFPLWALARYRNLSKSA